MISTTIKNVPLFFETDATIFSPKAVDAGTLAMLSVIDFAQNDKVLDLGCGYGVVGILAGRMVMVTKRLTWYKNKISSVFGRVKV